MLAAGLCSLDTRWRPLSIIVGLLPLYSVFFFKILFRLFCGVISLFEVAFTFHAFQTISIRLILNSFENISILIC
jgi:hypothetical protein